ncbi:MAG: LysM peptidoglycan-binding domain-containing protein [Verrucomicrobia bacterium]|nr:LysM peptidoglycan-binding domain-containing protein [Verrucomicrobiota bacterium]MBS0645100.1 LysM peptidoglycan-binding domain-containing protein [Verrucomicrobiota bacterium]
MSRRDTIIIAVLVNAGLLMVLFATALRSDHKKEKMTVLNAIESTNRANTSNVIEPLAQLVPSTLPELVVQQPTVPTLAPMTAVTVTEPIVLPESTPVVILEKPTPVAKPSVSEKIAQNTPSSYVSVTVKKGDVLDKIARAHQTSVATIMRENQLTSTDLKIGQVLRVPASSSAVHVTNPAQVVKTETSTATEYYVVKEGDNPWLIASKNHVKLEELLKINGLDEQSARRLRPGDRLKIR